MIEEELTVHGYKGREPATVGNKRKIDRVENGRGSGGSD